VHWLLFSVVQGPPTTHLIGPKYVGHPSPCAMQSDDVRHTVVNLETSMALQLI
jgi:hypothetical protein